MSFVECLRFFIHRKFYYLPYREFHLWIPRISDLFSLRRLNSTDHKISHSFHSAANSLCRSAFLRRCCHSLKAKYAALTIKMKVSEHFPLSVLHFFHLGDNIRLHGTCILHENGRHYCRTSHRPAIQSVKFKVTFWSENLCFSHRKTSESSWFWRNDAGIQCRQAAEWHCSSIFFKEYHIISNYWVGYLLSGA